MRLRIGEFGSGLQPLGHDLVRGLALQHALAAGIVSSIEAAQQLLELPMRMNGDAEHFGADAAVEALDHTVGLRRARPDVAILGAQGRTGFGEGCCEATAR